MKIVSILQKKNISLLNFKFLFVILSLLSLGIACAASGAKNKALGGGGAQGATCGSSNPCATGLSCSSGGICISPSVSCGQNMQTNPDTTSTILCICDAGYQSDGNGGCTICPANTSSQGVGDTCVACTSGQTSISGGACIASTTAASCTPNNASSVTSSCTGTSSGGTFCSTTGNCVTSCSTVNKFDNTNTCCPTGQTSDGTIACAAIPTPSATPSSTCSPICNGSTPICSNGSCTKCIQNSDCSALGVAFSNFACEPDGSCSQCNNLTVPKAGSVKCVICNTNTDCTGNLSGSSCISNICSCAAGFSPNSSGKCTANIVIPTCNNGTVNASNQCICPSNSTLDSTGTCNCSAGFNQNGSGSTMTCVPPSPTAFTFDNTPPSIPDAQLSLSNASITYTTEENKNTPDNVTGTTWPGISTCKSVTGSTNTMMTQMTFAYNDFAGSAAAAHFNGAGGFSVGCQSVNDIINRKILPMGVAGGSNDQFSVSMHALPGEVFVGIELGQCQLGWWGDNVVCKVHPISVPLTSIANVIGFASNIPDPTENPATTDQLFSGGDGQGGNYDGSKDINSDSNYYSISPCQVFSGSGCGYAASSYTNNGVTTTTPAKNGVDPVKLYCGPNQVLTGIYVPNASGGGQVGEWGGFIEKDGSSVNKNNKHVNHAAYSQIQLFCSPFIPGVLPTK